MFELFTKIIQKNRLENLTYVEPFAGGAGAALALLFLEKVDRIVINDFDRAIYSFWKSAVFESEAFVDKIYSIPVTAAEWRRQKLIYDNQESDCFDLGFATFFLNRTNVSGILTGGPIGGLDQSGKWKIDARFNKEGLAQRVRDLSLYRNRIEVFNEDGVDLIRRYLNKKDVFLYLDPPYYDKGAALYLNHYKTKDHARLSSRLNGNSDATWLLTYDDQQEIRDLYPDRRIVDFTLNYNAYESRKGREVLILSDAIKV